MLDHFDVAAQDDGQALTHCACRGKRFTWSVAPD
jgi:hypothetical protein